MNLRQEAKTRLRFLRCCVKTTVYLPGEKTAHEAVHNAVVAEEVAKMAARCEMLNPQVEPAPQELQDKHYYRKHGANAYYGQGNQ